MDGLFLAAPSADVLDRLAMTFDPHIMADYCALKNLAERNHLLREQAKMKAGCRLLKSSGRNRGGIMATRTQMLADICRISQSQDSHFPHISGQMTGQVADWLAAGLPAIDIEDQILSTARHNRLDSEARMPGAHDADFNLNFKGRSAHLASTGEQKALLISMILAHAKLQQQRLNKPPVLLLDDVVAHLDAGRREELFDLCQNMAAQTWYTGADKTAFER